MWCLWLFMKEIWYSIVYKRLVWMSFTLKYLLGKLNFVQNQNFEESWTQWTMIHFCVCIVMLCVLILKYFINACSSQQNIWCSICYYWFILINSNIRFKLSNFIWGSLAVRINLPFLSRLAINFTPLISSKHIQYRHQIPTTTYKNKSDHFYVTLEYVEIQICT